MVGVGVSVGDVERDGEQRQPARRAIRPLEDRLMRASAVTVTHHHALTAISVSLSVTPTPTSGCLAPILLVYLVACPDQRW